MVPDSVTDTHQFDLDGLFQGVRAAAGQQVGVDPQAAQHCHAVLGGLGLLLPNHAQHWNKTDVHAAEVPSAHSELELPALSSGNQTNNVLLAQAKMTSLCRSTTGAG